MRVVITGAAGNIGSQLVEELSGSHDLFLVDIRPSKGQTSIIADLSVLPGGRWSWLKPKSASRSDLFKRARVAVPFYRRWMNDNGTAWIQCMKGADVVVHLAANPNPEAAWEQVLGNNINATWNVCETAARHGVPRVVFASSNYAVKALENELAPDCYAIGGPKIGSDAAPRPLTPYGLSKAAGECVGEAFVAQRKLQSFAAVRIGAFAATPAQAPQWRNLWIGIRDIRDLLRRCVEAEFTGFHIVYGVSAQPTAPYDLSHTHRLLSWAPQQTAAF